MLNYIYCDTKIGNISKCGLSSGGYSCHLPLLLTFSAILPPESVIPNGSSIPPVRLLSHASCSFIFIFIFKKSIIAQDSDRAPRSKMTTIVDTAGFAWKVNLALK